MVRAVPCGRAVALALALALTGVARAGASEPAGRKTPSPAPVVSPAAEATPSADPATPLPSPSADPATPLPSPVEATPTPAATVEPAPSPSPSPSPLAATAAEPPPASRTRVGGYGELHYRNVNGPDAGAYVDLRRVVFTVVHAFGDPRLRALTDIAVEHGGEGLEVEQAAIEMSWTPWIGVRGGLVLVPVGILHRSHDPTSFLGVRRTSVDTILLPTAWREAGVVLFGAPLERVRWQLGFLNGLNAAGFDAASGLRSGRSGIAQAAANDGAVVLRLEGDPLAGLILGGSLYAGGAGRQEIEAPVAVQLAELDAQLERGGVWIRAQLVEARIDGAGALDDYLASGTAPLPPVGERLRGGYAEIACDLVSLARRTRLGRPVPQGVALRPFVRYERTHTQLDMPRGHDADPRFDRSAATLGAVLHPHPRLALKADTQWAWTASIDPANAWHLGLAWRF